MASSFNKSLFINMNPFNTSCFTFSYKISIVSNNPVGYIMTVSPHPHVADENVSMNGFVIAE